MLLPFTDGLIRTTHCDQECRAVADRHYNRQSPGAPQFTGNGEKIVLRDALGQVLFAWIYQQWRLDSQRGYNCAIFRNESARLSSEIILEAERFAVERWGLGRAFTFVDSRKIRSVNPGCCFKKAGWRFAGFTKSGKHIFEKHLI